MEYIRTDTSGQPVLEQSTGYLFIPSQLYGFHNTETVHQVTYTGRGGYIHYGHLDIPSEERICPCCGAAMHINSHPEVTLRHLPIGGELSVVRFSHNQFRCPKCGTTRVQFIPFKACKHRMTEQLYQFARGLRALNAFNNKQINHKTGLGENVVKDIDLERLKEKYTADGKLIKPEQQARYLGIDEFLLHKGRRFATLIVGLETDHILWIGYGKCKQVVDDFIDHVGFDWMDGVEAVACDMNSNYQEAFKERCPHIQPVFDHFHIVKNFNDKVVFKVRIEEQKHLM